MNDDDERIHIFFKWRTKRQICGILFICFYYFNKEVWIKLFYNKSTRIDLEKQSTKEVHIIL